MIEATDLGVDADLARRVLVRARSIAPCLDSLVDERRAEAIAILKAVAQEIPPAGSRRVKSKSRNGTAITFENSGSWFDSNDEAGLRSLCAAAGSTPGLPIGSFPEARVFSGIWPEEKYI